MLEAADRIGVARERLTELDARIGDGDHGINLARGMSLVANDIRAFPAADAGETLVSSGRRLIGSVGGASGPLYGTLLLDAGTTLVSADGTVGERLAAAVAAGVAGVGRRGRSTVGQKTMLDTLVPASAALTAAVSRGLDLEPAVRLATDAGLAGCESTRTMTAQRGRASYLGERSIGHLDPGAVSSVLLLEALAAAVAAGQPVAPGATRR